MRYRLKIKTFKNGDVVFIPQYKYKYCPFWISFGYEFYYEDTAIHFINNRIQERIDKRGMKLLSIRYSEIRE